MLRREEKKAEQGTLCVAEEEVPYMTKAEILANFDHIVGAAVSVHPNLRGPRQRVGHLNKPHPVNVDRNLLAFAHGVCKHPEFHFACPFVCVFSNAAVWLAALPRRMEEHTNQHRDAGQR
jgi:hypothetical protein